MQGGVPIKAGTETIGAIGVSGAPGGDKDEACANAGIEISCRQTEVGPLPPKLAERELLAGLRSERFPQRREPLLGKSHSAE